MTVARRAPGPAYANLQGRKPREVWRDRASNAMGISVLAVCCGVALNACLGSDRGGDETFRPVATGRTGAALECLDDDHAAAAARARVRGFGVLDATVIAGLGLFRRHVEQAACLGNVVGACRWRAGRSGGCGGSQTAGRGS